ncbi:helix-turn-helix domain-containing protein [Pseudomonas tremae]|uniref:helix-turn-helix domain-containing protein n=1 Tax=Pseudomonas tremae TaxID=200454 RepID=UPI001F48A93B|nr:helix-turn-helix domain-containing protein [Pseudomonas tremae]MCF5711046.1 transcriptional regulator [Pseudomonas tremae]UQB32231.1 helix-turn-helix domain-containing protein [Pseudomonas tremae]
MGASDRRYVNKLEHGVYNLSLEKLRSICTDIGVSPLTFLTLTLSTADGESISDLLLRTQSELDDFESSGGLCELKRQLADGALVSRRPGKRGDPQRLKNVLKCKAEGMTQKATAELLGIPKQTVHDLWKRDGVRSSPKPPSEL